MRQAVIWKHTLKFTDAPQDIIMPASGQIIHVELQYDAIRLWEMHEAEGPEQPMVVPRTFCIVGTGHYSPEGYNVYQYCGTVMMGEFVWHILELAKSS